MAKKTALITGMAGQDGSYLAEHLLALDYKVHGIVRRNSVPEHQESRLDHLANEVTTHYGDLLDSGSMDRIIGEVAPDEVYNLGAQSHVRISYEIPSFTAGTNALGAMSLLEVLRNSGSQARFYQASSSEMFGDSVDEDFYQRETTPMHPVSPYGCSKLFAYHATRNYRKAFGMFAANGILFNHESPRRGSNFVTSKIVKTAVEIKLGRATELVLGNLDSKRDWGHSKDYVRAMHLILNHESPDDFVVATGDTRSVRELVEIVFSELGLIYEHHIRQDPKYMRPEELPYLRGDASKVKKTLGWEPRITFDEMVQEMVSYWHSKLSSS